MIGKVKTLTEKGYGFIQMGKGEKDMFFHLRNLHGVNFTDLQVGDELEFDVEQGDKGAYAVNIERAPEDAA